VVSEEITVPEYVEGAVAAGLPAEVAYGLAELFTELLDGRNVATTTTVADVLGRPPTALASTIRRAVESGCFGPPW
jgi:hypothetical protein